MIDTISPEAQRALEMRCNNTECDGVDEDMIQCSRSACKKCFHVKCAGIGKVTLENSNEWWCTEACKYEVRMLKLQDRFDAQKKLLNQTTTNLGQFQAALKKRTEKCATYKTAIEGLEQKVSRIPTLEAEIADLKAKLAEAQESAKQANRFDAEVDRLLDDESDEELKKSLHAVFKDQSFALLHTRSSSPLIKDSPSSSEPKPKDRQSASSRNIAHKDIDEMTENEKLTHFQRLHVQRLEVPKLMKYSGDPAEWLSFKSSFERLRDKGEYDNETMIEKLRESLTGDAEKYVKQRLNQPFAGADNIMEVLKKKFFQPKEAVAKALKTLENWKVIPEKCRTELESFLFEVDNYVFLCETLKFEPELRVAINSRITNKLPYDVEVKWQQHVSAEKIKGTIKELSAFLWELVPNLPLRETETRQHETAKRGESAKATINLASNESSDNKSKKFVRATCWQCGGDEKHFLYKCPKFRELSYEEKCKTLSRHNVCTRCIASNQHAAINCPKVSRLPKCGKKDCPNPAAHCSLMHPSSSNSSGGSHSASVHHVAGVASTLFKVVPIYVCDAHGNKVETTALIDGGAGASLINKDFFNKLGLSGKPYKLELKWMQPDASHSDSLAIKHDLQIAPIHKPNRIITLSDVSAIEGLTLPMQGQNARQLKREYPYLRDAKIPSYEKQRPQILLGLPHQRYTIALDTIWDPNLESAPIAQRTPLGWTVSGGQWSDRSIVHICEGPPSECSHEEDTREPSEEESLSELHETIKHFHSFDVLGIQNPNQQHLCRDDAAALKTMRLTMRQVGNRYEIGLYWRNEDCELPDNYATALNRLKTTEMRLRKLDMVEWANNHQRELRELGFVREATTDDLNPEKPHKRVNYVIGFVTFNMNKQPPKARWVVDTASKHNGVSLNSQLLKGPDNLVPLTQALFHFRERAIAMVGDITKMYHQVLIQKEDQQVQRFLWRDCDRAREPTVYIFQSMLFGPTCSPSQANSVRIDVAKKLKHRFPDGSRVALTSMYMDDEFNSEDTPEKAAAVANETIELFQTISWDSVGFKSNSEAALKLLPPVNVDTELVLDLGAEDEQTCRKVLGLTWNPTKDAFIFKVAKNVDMISLTLHDDYHPTKLEVLSFIMRIFDCLGIISHFVIRGKMILQSIWRCGIGWKERIPKDIFDAWRLWIAQFDEIERLEIPRHYGYDSRFAREVTLHVFVDASLEAYAAVAFIRFEQHDSVKVAQIMAKCRVAPVKYASVPKLELMAALIGARLANTIKKQHTRIKFESTTFWSDSITVLRWLYAPNLRLQQFVAPRVSEIQETTDVNDWRYVPTAENVADDGTKWNEIDFSSSAQRWLNGPAFLQKDENEWPAKFPANVNLQEHRILLATLKETESGGKVEGLYYAGVVEGVSSKVRGAWKNYRMVVAWVKRFASNVLASRNNSKSSRLSVDYCEEYVNKSAIISPEELRAAEHEIFRRIQRVVFAEEISYLSKGRQLRLSSKLYELNAYLDSDGLVRAKTRMAMEETIPYDMRCPPILPNKHESVHAFLKYLHEKSLHIGVEGTAAEARSQTWIVYVRKAVQRVKSQCLYCIDQKARHQIPPAAPLPSFRLTPTSHAFEHCGVDCCGPFTIYTGRSKHKRDIWVVVFTCMVTRAIYLRKLDSMTSDEMLLAIQDIWTRRGPIRHMYSDNGRNFVGAARIIKANHLQTLAEEKKLTWHFIPALTPQWGGAWERLIRDIKRAMKAEMRGKVIGEKVFDCMLLQVEDIMNARPLTHLPVSPDDLSPITPNYLVKQHPGYAFVQGDARVEDDEARLYAKRARRLSEALTKRWVKEYLSNISHPKKKGPAGEGLKVGDYVIYTDPTVKPANWKRGVVIQTYEGRDGLARVADVKVSENDILTRRSVVRLAKLNIDAKYFESATLLLNEVVSESFRSVTDMRFLRVKAADGNKAPHFNYKFRKIAIFFNNMADSASLSTVATIRLWNELGQVNFYPREAVVSAKTDVAAAIKEMLREDNWSDPENTRTIKINRLPATASLMEIIVSVTKLNWSLTKLSVDSISQPDGFFAYATMESREEKEEAVKRGQISIGGIDCKVTEPYNAVDVLRSRSNRDFGYIAWHRERLTSNGIIIVRQRDSEAKVHAVPRFTGAFLKEYVEYMSELDRAFVNLVSAEPKPEFRQERVRAAPEKQMPNPGVLSVVVRPEEPDPARRRSVVLLKEQQSRESARAGPSSRRENRAQTPRDRAREIERRRRERELRHRRAERRQQEKSRRRRD